MVFNEIVDLPNDLMALGRPRSSLCRVGATLGTAVWDAGYRGRSTALLIVKTRRHAHCSATLGCCSWSSLPSMRPTARGYDGTYQGENSASSRRLNPGGRSLDGAAPRPGTGICVMASCDFRGFVTAGNRAEVDDGVGLFASGS